MRRILVFILTLLIFPTFIYAQTLEEDRRVEEGKRESLRSTEAQIASEKREEERLQPLDPIDVAYLSELIPKRVTFRYDLCKVLVILMDVEDEYLSLDSQVAYLKQKKLIPKKLVSDFDPMKPLRKGLAAYMLCKALDIRGGICLKLLGIRERYALKELVYKGMMSSGTTNDILTGDELFFAYMQATNYRKNNRKKPIVKN